MVLDKIVGTRRVSILVKALIYIIQHNIAEIDGKFN